ncbi:MAG: Gfo/Idh/MocA family oxidoreductase [Ancrocorticia sp.]|uniref:Gfo/Idh/MocA family oxidoreductase n=1 Tax=Ancrocorticia sp. TaxID=2593684 RepID=UPI003F9396BA
MISFALLGAGFIGQVHARNLAAHPGINFACVFDADAFRANEIARTYETTAASSIDEILCDSSIDAVLIASSTNTHADLLKQAAPSGKAILCEKPIDLNVTVAEEAARVVQDSGVPAMIDLNRRFDPSNIALRDAVAAGEVGSVELVQMSSRGPSLPPIDYLKVSGGQMRDQVVHFFDLLCWISGLEPVSVYATGSALVDPEVKNAPDVDTSAVILMLSNGAICQIDAQRRIGYGYDERIEVNGSASMVEAARQRTGWVNRYSAEKISTNAMHPGWFERIAPTYRSALDHFVEAMTNGEQPSPSVEDGLRAQRIAEAATESLHTGLPVQIK